MERRFRCTGGWCLAAGLTLIVAALLVFTPSTGSAARQRVQVGLASYYGPGFHGERAASGEIFDQNALSAAHRTLPLGTLVRVTNLENGRSVELPITDRGPYGANRRKGTIIDVSKAAARKLRFIEGGLVRVRVEVIQQADDDDGE